jgi:hypothetical protein
MAGRASGSMMYQKICSQPTPSMRAASSMSCGMARKNCIIRKTPMGTAMRGRISA